MFSFTVILYKLDNYYVCLLGKSGMHRLKLSIMFDTLGQLATEILVILKVYPHLIFGDFSLLSNVVILIFTNNMLIRIYYH